MSHAFFNCSNSFSSFSLVDFSSLIAFFKDPTFDCLVAREKSVFTSQLSKVSMSSLSSDSSDSILDNILYYLLLSSSSPSSSMILSLIFSISSSPILLMVSINFCFKLDIAVLVEIALLGLLIWDEAWEITSDSFFTGVSSNTDLLLDLLLSILIVDRLLLIDCYELRGRDLWMPAPSL